MPSSISRQQQIAQWFDMRYRVRGIPYLRPVDAYRIYVHLLKMAPGNTLLDTACGPGQLLMAAQPSGAKLFGIDISAEAIRQCKLRLPQAQAQVANAEALPFEDEQFDYLTCLGSLERFIDLPRALAEQLRVAKPHARFCFLVRNANAPTWQLVKKHLGIRNHTGHQTARSLTEWRITFESAGFEILQVHPDQWPLVRWRRWLTAGRGAIDYTRLRKGWLPLEKAYEFIFVLKKR